MSETLRRRAKEIAGQADDLFRSLSEHQNHQANAGGLSLAHYTSLEAIISMLQAEDGGLRLSDSSTMMDPEEGKAAIGGQPFSKLLDEQPGMDSWLRSRYSSANVCCFVGVQRGEDGIRIDAGDDLLFWRLYGNECRGVSITIPSLVADKLLTNSRVQRVVYTDEPSLRGDPEKYSLLLSDLDSLYVDSQEAGLWAEVYRHVLPSCDLLFGQRFLHKRSHYEMEREYRAVAFVTREDGSAAEDSELHSHGKHVQYGRVRTYAELSDLSCESIFTTNSQITIGSNVQEGENVRVTLRSLLEGSSIKVPSAVSIRVSAIPYRSR